MGSKRSVSISQEGSSAGNVFVSRQWATGSIISRRDGGKETAMDRVKRGRREAVRIPAYRLLRRAVTSMPSPQPSQITCY